MAGIPPLVGFFAKQMVLYSSTHAGYYFLSIVAILVSVISASYYLKIVRVMYFDNSSNNNNNTSYKDNVQDMFIAYNTKNTNLFLLLQSENTKKDYFIESLRRSITNVHALIISSLTMFISLFLLKPNLLLNSCHLLALSLFYY